jgi:hypothetical protein
MASAATIPVTQAEAFMFLNMDFLTFLTSRSGGWSAPSLFQVAGRLLVGGCHSSLQ